MRRNAPPHAPSGLVWRRAPSGPSLLPSGARVCPPRRAIAGLPDIRSSLGISGEMMVQKAGNSPAP